MKFRRIAQLCRALLNPLRIPRRLLLLKRALFGRVEAIEAHTHRIAEYQDGALAALAARLDRIEAILGAEPTSPGFVGMNEIQINSLQAAVYLVETQQEDARHHKARFDELKAGLATLTSEIEKLRQQAKSKPSADGEDSSYPKVA